MDNSSSTSRVVALGGVVKVVWTVAAFAVGDNHGGLPHHLLHRVFRSGVHERRAGSVAVAVPASPRQVSGGLAVLVVGSGGDRHQLAVLVRSPVAVAVTAVALGWWMMMGGLGWDGVVVRMRRHNGLGRWAAVVVVGARHRGEAAPRVELEAHPLLLARLTLGVGVDSAMLPNHCAFWVS